MKNLIFFLAVLFTVQHAQAQFQNIDASHWCINSIQIQTDTNGAQFTSVEIYNNDIALDSSFNFTFVEALIKGTDTIMPTLQSSLSNYMEVTNRDTQIAFRIDTTISITDITGILVRRAMPGCGIMLLESINVTNVCGSLYPLGTSLFTKNEYLISPNPTSSLLYIKGHQIEKCNVKLFSIDGKIMLNENIKTNTSINLSTLSRGMYYLHINDQFIQKILLN